MMSEDVYKEIYSTAYAAPAGDFVEVGTAHAAATVVMAMAKKDSGKPGRVITFDKFAASSRRHYQDASMNLPIVMENLRVFGVDDVVDVISGDISRTATLYRGTSISLLMLDADGRIDRDLLTFGDRVKDEAPVIIDDYADRARVKLRSPTEARIDQKHRLTFHLVHAFEREMVLKRRTVIYQTWFGVKDLCSPANIRSNAVLNAYRELVFADATVTQ